jgi:Dodecin
MAFDKRTAIDRFWEARRSGEFFPADWRDRLDFDQAYRIQLGIVARQRDRSRVLGESEQGWEDAARQVVAEATKTLHGVTSVYAREFQATVENDG